MSATNRAPGDAAGTLSIEQVSELLSLLKGVDSAELKLSVPDANRRSVVAALGMDPLDAQIRQVIFFDTPELTLNAAGLVVRARRIQQKAGDTVIKIRPIVPEEVSPRVRMSPAFSVEVDAMPGGFVCSGAMKAIVDDADVKATTAGDRPLRKLFTKEQRALFADRSPGGLGLDDLTPLGPITVLKLKFKPVGFDRRMVAELWNYPDGSRILELSTKCAPNEAFQAATETREFLTRAGIDLSAEQQTKTKTALQFFAAEVATAG